MRQVLVLPSASSFIGSFVMMRAMLQDKSKRRLLALVMLLVVFLVIYALISTGYGQRINFQEYRPAYLPAGIATANGELYVLRDKGVIPSFKKHININLNAPNSWLAEWKSDGQLTSPCSESSKDTGCSLYTTKSGQNYQLVIIANSPSADYFVYDLRFIKGNTEIWITLRDTKENISVDEWERVVESFEPTHFEGLRVVRGSSSGP